MAKTKLLNVRKHLEHIQLILDGLNQDGYCPVVKHEAEIASLLNRAILRKHQAKGTRKDIYIPR